jgi:cell division GTPase FtsZ
MGGRGIIGVDLADIRAALEHPDNITRIGVGYGAGATRTRDATCRALHELGMTVAQLGSATGMFVLIAGASFKLTELRDVTNVVRSVAGEEAHVYPGAYCDERLRRLLRVTVVISVPADAQ